MTTTHKALILLVTFGVIGGASYLGYRAYKDSEDELNKGKNTTQTTSTTPVITTTTTTTTTPTSTAIVPPNIDSTWRTYHPKDNAFEFMWPTAGKYYPQWEQKYVYKGNAGLTTDGCYSPDASWNAQKFSVNSLNFCQTSKSLTTGDKTFLTDNLAVSKDQNQYVVLTFTKSYPTTSTTFKLNEYDQLIKQIASTFHFTKSATSKTQWNDGQSAELKLSFQYPSTDTCTFPTAVGHDGTCTAVDANGQPLGYTPDASISLYDKSIDQVLQDYDQIDTRENFTTTGGLTGLKVSAAYGKGLCTSYLVALDTNKTLQFMPWECDGAWDPLDTIARSIKKN